MIAGLKEYLENDIFLCYWIITRNCNYYCNYCVCPKLPSSFDSNNETISAAIKAINHLSTTKPLDLIITGGEPTLKDLYDILPKLNIIRPIILFTNLSQSVEYYLELNKIKPIRLYASLHPSQVKKEVFIEKIRILSEVMQITVKTMILNQNNKEIIDLLKVIKNDNIILEYLSNLPVDLSGINNDKIYQYGNSEISIYDMMKISNFKGWECTAPGNALCIDYNGNVYTCKRHFQKKKPLPFTIFNNFKENFNQLPKTTICPMNNCTSELEIKKTKL